MSALAAVRALTADRASAPTRGRVAAADDALLSTGLAGVRLSLHFVERAEVEDRVELDAEEERERAALPACRVPDALIYRVKLATAKAALLDGPAYQGLITRQFKREERVLELFTELLQRASADQDSGRLTIIIDEHAAAYSLERYGSLLAYYAIAGYAETTIAVETDEREMRARVVSEERQVVSEMFEELDIDAELAMRAASSRVAQNEDELAVVCDKESIGRWHVTEAEDAARVDYERDFLETWRRLCRRLEWCIATGEADGRYAIEREEQRVRARDLWRGFEERCLAVRDRDAYEAATIPSV